MPSAKLYFVAFGEGFLWLFLIGACLFFGVPGGILHPDWTSISWFELLLFSLLVIGTVGCLYRVASCAILGQLIRRELVNDLLPITKDISLSLAGYSSARIIIFSPTAKLSFFCGEISVRNARNDILEQLLLNKSEAGEVKFGGKTQRIRSGGKSARVEIVSILSLPQIDPVNTDVRVHFELDWNARDERYQPRNKPINIEVLVRGVKGHAAPGTLSAMR